MASLHNTILTELPVAFLEYMHIELVNAEKLSQRNSESTPKATGLHKRHLGSDRYMQREALLHKAALVAGMEYGSYTEEGNNHPHTMVETESLRLFACKVGTWRDLPARKEYRINLAKQNPQPLEQGTLCGIPSIEDSKPENMPKTAVFVTFCYPNIDRMNSPEGHIRPAIYIGIPNNSFDGWDYHISLNSLLELLNDSSSKTATTPQTDKATPKLRTTPRSGIQDNPNAQSA